MRKFITLASIIFVTGVHNVYSQTQNSNQQIVLGKVNDWGGLFNDAQKNQLDSVSMLFAFKTNMPISVITFGSANTTQQLADAFVEHTDSLMFQNHDDETIMGIFLSKDFRVLNFQVHTPAGVDTSNIGDWKVKMKQMFTTSAQPHIPLLKDGKYAEALIAIISDLGISVKKEM